MTDNFFKICLGLGCFIGLIIISIGSVVNGKETKFDECDNRYRLEITMNYKDFINYCLITNK